MTSRQALVFDAGQIQALPLPIAVALVQLSGAETERSLLTLWHASDAIELVLRVLASMLFSEVVRHDEVMLELAPKLTDFNYRRPTLGQWKVLVDQLLATLKANPALLRQAPHFVPLVELWSTQLFARFFDGKGHPESKDKESYVARFTKLRNRIAHGAGLTGEAADILLEPWAGRIREFIDAISKWLATLSFYGQGADGVVLLRGDRPVPSDTRPPPELQGRQPWIEHGGRVLSLWPLMLYEVPKAPGMSLDEADRAVEVYASLDTEGTKVHFTPIGCRNTKVHWSVGDPETSAAFLNAFRHLRVEETKVVRGALLSFRAEILADGKLMMGQTASLHAVMQAIDQRRHRVLWIQGKAGSGKSTLLARVVHDLLDRQRAEELAGSV